MAPPTTSGPVSARHASTLPELLRAVALRHPETDAYVEGDERITFGALMQESENVAAALRRHGVTPGDVVAILLPTSIDYAIAYLATAIAGGVATGVSTRIGPDDLGAILDESGPTLTIVDPDLRLPRLPNDLRTMDRTEMARARRGPGPKSPWPAASPEDPVTIVWTSGTTGTPKGAWFDHRNLASALHTAGVMTAPFDRRLLTTPMPHAGFMAKVWDQLANAQTNIISPLPWTAESMAALLQSERITTAGATPTQWMKLLECATLPDPDELSLRVCVGAMAPIPPDLVRDVSDRLGAPMIVRYAMTESPSVSGTTPDDPADKLVSTVGRPQPGVEIRILDDAGRDVDGGATGRIHIRGACVMRGYWGRPDLTAATLNQGWLRSNDLGRLDSEGFLVLDGRADDMYIRGGYNVHPLEVERTLELHPAIARAAAFGVEAPVIGEIGVAAIIPEAGTEAPTLDEVRAWITAHLADYKAPDRVHVVDQLPLTPMLKIDKKALRRSLQEDSPT